MFVAYQGVTKRKKTIEILRRARDAAPSDVRSYLGLASLFMQTGKTKKAAKVIQSAVKALAKSAQTKPIPRNLYVALLHHLGAQLLSFSEFSAAQKTMRLVRLLNPILAELRTTRGGVVGSQWLFHASRRPNSASTILCAGPRYGPCCVNCNRWAGLSLS